MTVVTLSRTNPTAGGFRPAPTGSFGWASVRLAAAVLITAILMITSAGATTTNIAVAANFIGPANALAERFAAATGHTTTFSFGSTGHLYAQITQAAPYDAFLAADAARPKRAVVEGFADPDSRFTYAVGRLALWSPNPKRVVDERTLGTTLRGTIAIANPVTAPYGAAALQVMTALGVRDALADRIVHGNSVTQVHQFVATGNVELGFLALAQVVAIDNGSWWTVPQTLHTPIHQQAVLLKRGADNPATVAFLDFLRQPETAAMIEGFGYGAGDTVAAK